VGPDTREAILLCEAAGYQTILVETVGVGQSETTVSKMVDFFMLLMMPGSGDDLQGIKRGIMELADLIVITKADGDLRDLAKKAQADFAFALKLFPPSSLGWVPKAMAVSALKNEGISMVWEQVLAFQNKMRESGNWDTSRQEQLVHWLHDALEERLKSDFYRDPTVSQTYKRLLEKVKTRSISVHQAVGELMKHYKE